MSKTSVFPKQYHFQTRVVRRSSHTHTHTIKKKESSTTSAAKRRNCSFSSCTSSSISTSKYSPSTSAMVESLSSRVGSTTIHPNNTLSSLTTTDTIMMDGENTKMNSSDSPSSSSTETNDTTTTTTTTATNTSTTTTTHTTTVTTSQQQQQFLAPQEQVQQVQQIHQAQMAAANDDRYKKMVATPTSTSTSTALNHPHKPFTALQTTSTNKYSPVVNLMCTLWASVCFFSLWIPAYFCSVVCYKVCRWLGMDTSRAFTSQFMRVSSRLAVKLNPFWNIKYMELEQAPKKNTNQGRLIFICNHQSNMDPIAINSVFDWNAKWVSKDSIFNVPFGKYKSECVCVIQETLFFNIRRLHDASLWRYSTNFCN